MAGEDGPSGAKGNVNGETNGKTKRKKKNTLPKQTPNKPKAKAAQTREAADPLGIFPNQEKRDGASSAECIARSASSGVGEHSTKLFVLSHIDENG